MAGNENNPYAQNPSKGTKPGDPGHVVTLEEMQEANVDGNPNPVRRKDLSDAEIMSGKERGGIPMDRAQAAATEANEALQKNQGEQWVQPEHKTQAGETVKTPPNTPSI